MIRFILIFILFYAGISIAQTNPYGLKMLGTMKEYQASASADPDNRLVEIKKYIPGIKLDIRYATSNNFIGKAVYHQSRAFTRLPVVKALKDVQNELNKKGLGLKIFDAYRPYSVTAKFYELASDKSFVASPKSGSRHNRGCAIDLTVISLKSGKELKMPAGYDSFSPEASAHFKDLPENVLKNRDMLQTVMKKHGFILLENEWWHFDFKGWENYILMDIPFEKL